MTEGLVTIISKEGDRFSLPRDASEIITKMYETGAYGNEIPFPSVETKWMCKVIEYNNEKEKTEEWSFSFIEEAIKDLKPRDAIPLLDVFCISSLLMGFEPLAKTIAKFTAHKYIKGKTPDEIRENLGIPEAKTEEERERLLQDYEPLFSAMNKEKNAT